MLDFCPVCDNMLYMRGSDRGEVTLACSYCDTREPLKLEPSRPRSLMVTETNYQDERAKYMHLVTVLLHQDPTLPRTAELRCPNAECVRREGAPASVLFYKYDKRNLKYLYSCAHCRFFWGPEGLARYAEDDDRSASPSASPSPPVGGPAK